MTFIVRDPMTKTAFPAVYALLGSKVEPNYCLVFQALRNLLINLYIDREDELKGSSFTADFEKALVGGINTLFSN